MNREDTYMRLTKWIINILIVITLFAYYKFYKDPLNTYEVEATINFILFHLLVVVRVCLTALPPIMKYIDKKTGKDIDWWKK